MKNIEVIKNKAIVFAWITGLLVLIATLWILTQPLQRYYLLRTVNSVMIASGDPRRIIEYTGRNEGITGLFGYWFSMFNSESNFTGQMFIFPVFQDGILVPFGAVVADNGRVDDLIPLSAHAVEVMDKIPQSILQVYVTRIETAVRANMEGDYR